MAKTKATDGQLTGRETQVVRLVSLGCTLVEAAKILHLSTNTVDNHKANAMAKLGTDKAALLTRVALKRRVTTMKDRLTPAEKRRSGRKNDGWN
ncbi:MAG TPA: helix-turn-helix transcriptional regulator [Thermoguttaceae bacterium]|nr:helix-turn-helix transcriptional regulator [Thermoguttaceae bacterium]